MAMYFWRNEFAHATKKNFQLYQTIPVVYTYVWICWWQRLTNGQIDVVSNGFLVRVWPIHWQFSNNIQTVIFFCFQLTFWICNVILCVWQIACSPKWKQVKQWWFLDLLPYFSEHIWFRGLRLHTRYRHSVWYLVSDLLGIYSKQTIAITTVPMT